MNKKKIESLEDMISVSETFSDAYNMFVSLINKNCVSGVVMYFQSCITIAAVYHSDLHFMDYVTFNSIRDQLLKLFRSVDSPEVI